MASVVVDIGASNVEDMMGQMQRYRGSHEDFDGFVVPAVPRLKQQMDTIATLVELNRIGVPAARLKLVFNMIEDGDKVAQAFDPLLTFLKQHPIARANPKCCLGANEIYARIKRYQDRSGHLGERSDGYLTEATASSREAQLRAMQEGALEMFKKEVDPVVRRVSAKLQQLALLAQPRKNLWMPWLTHGSAFVTGAALTRVVVVVAIWVR